MLPPATPPSDSWQAVVDRLVRASDVRELKSAMAVERAVRASGGADLGFLVPPMQIGGLEGGWLVWSYRGGRGDEDGDGFRALIWREHGHSRGQLLESGDNRYAFGYGEGVLFGPAKTIGRDLVLAGNRYGMTPYGFGAIEIWSRSPAGWIRRRTIEAQGELDRIPKFIGNDVVMRLHRYPAALEAPHSGPHIFYEVRYRYRAGTYAPHVTRIETIIAAVDDLALARRGSDALGRSRTLSAALWRRLKAIFPVRAQVVDESDEGVVVADAANEARQIKLTLRRIGGRWRVTRFERVRPR